MCNRVTLAHNSFRSKTPAKEFGCSISVEKIIGIFLLGTSRNLFDANSLKFYKSRFSKKKLFNEKKIIVVSTSLATNFSNFFTTFTAIKLSGF